MAILERYDTPASILSAGKETLADVIGKAAGKGRENAMEKAGRLQQAAQGAMTFGHGNPCIRIPIHHYVEITRLLEKQTETLLKQVRQSLKERPDSQPSKQTGYKELSRGKSQIAGE